MTDESPSVKERLVSWERLRLIYNVVMLLAGIPIAASIYRIVQALPATVRNRLTFDYSASSIIMHSILFGILANIAYLFGPILEVYWTAFTRRKFGRRARYCVFAIGLVFSVAVQAVVLCFHSLLEFLVMH